MPLLPTFQMSFEFLKSITPTRVSDIPEILGDTGYLVPPSSPEQLAQKIQ
jgi:glycosyltransferase involved in cell wall biosynthesis